MNRVRDLRLQAGMQQKELAVAVGVSRPTVSEWEHQKKDPTGERLKKHMFKTCSISVQLCACCFHYIMARSCILLRRV